MKKIFTFLLVLVTNIGTISASDTEVDGIWYDFDSSTQIASVTKPSSNFRYTGNIVIPSSVTYNGTTYSVTSIGERAFSGCSSLTSITIPNSVTSIGERAFNGCSSLTSVTIPNSVTSIGNLAFSACSGLTSVTIGDSVTSIGEGAFSGCSSLTSVAIGNSVTSIGERAFWGCSSMTSLTIPNSITSIGDEAFWGCSSLTSVTIGDSVTSIGHCAFWGCSSLASVTIPNSVTSIGDRAFYNCSGMTSLTIGNSVTSIGERAFWGCSSMTSLTIPNSVTSIGDEAFYNCSGMVSITVGANLKSLGKQVFSYCQNLTNVIWNAKEYPDCLYTPFYDAKRQITSFILGDSVQYIPANLCDEISNLPSVTIGENVKSVGDTPFTNCSSLKFVIWNAKKCSDLSNTPFQTHLNGSAVTSFTFGDSVKYIPAKLCIGMMGLSSITIPNSVASIGDGAFEGCSGLTSVTIPNSVTSIGDRAFYNCSSLKSVIWNAKNYHDSSSDPFYNIASQITSFTFGNSVEYIPAHLCYKMTHLNSITIPNSVTSIGDGAFEGCSGLTDVTIGNSVTSIGLRAFDDCSRLTKTNYTGDIAGWCTIEFGNHDSNPICYSKNLFIYDQEIKDLVIPNTVDTIRQYTFFNCKSLTSVTISDSVTSIENSAFKNCSSLTDVTIGNGVNSIGNSAFYYCSSLTSVTCKAEAPPTVGSSAFWGVPTSIPVYVPCGCVSAYNTASGWSDFSNIRVPSTKYSIEVDVNDTMMGTAKVDYNTFCKGSQISATPNIGYHFVQWSDGNTDNPRTLLLTQDTTLTAEFSQSFSGQCGDSLYWELIDTTLQITGSGSMYYYNPNTAPWKLLVTSIKSLTIAEEVTKLNRAFDSCSMLESVVWNAKNYADFTEKKSALFYAICSQIKSFIFGKNVEYIPAYLCYGMEKMTSITIPNSVTSIGNYAFNNCSGLTTITIGNRVTNIGNSAFEGCSSLTSMSTPNSLKIIGTSAFDGCIRLGEISLGTGLEEIAANAFASCTRLYDIYSYATYPPFAEESSFANYNVYLHIPCENQEDYTLDMVWGQFKHIECIGADNVENTDDVVINAGATDVTITWPSEENANTYTIVIEKDGEVFCTLTFDADGQLLNMAFAPGRDGHHIAQYAEALARGGFRFTVTGLNEQTRYGYDIRAKDTDDNTIQSHSGEFTTKENASDPDTPTTVVDVESDETANIQKMIRDGQLVIIRDGKTYNTMGQEL